MPTDWAQKLPLVGGFRSKGVGVTPVLYIALGLRHVPHHDQQSAPHNRAGHQILCACYQMGYHTMVDFRERSCQRMSQQDTDK